MVPIINTPQPEQTVEICRSYAYKLNLANHGGPAYESADFFASRKLTCRVEDAAFVSQEIYEECVTEVRAAVKRYLEEMSRKMAARKEGPQRRTA